MDLTVFPRISGIDFPVEYRDEVDAVGTVHVAALLAWSHSGRGPDVQAASAFERRRHAGFFRNKREKVEANAAGRPKDALRLVFAQDLFRAQRQGRNAVESPNIGEKFDSGGVECIGLDGYARLALGGDDFSELHFDCSFVWLRSKPQSWGVD